MPSYTLTKAKRPYKHPWRARVKVNGKEYYLGYWGSKEEAANEEREFRLYMKGSNKSKQTRWV